MRSRPDRPNWRAALWLRRQRIRGRRRFVWGWLVPRFTVPAALLATLLRAATEPFSWGHFLIHLVVNLLGAGVLGGYVTGRLLWELIVARDRRRRASVRRRASARDREPRRSERLPPRGDADPRR